MPAYDPNNIFAKILRGQLPAHMPPLCRRITARVLTECGQSAAEIASGTRPIALAAARSYHCRSNR